MRDVWRSVSLIVLVLCGGTRAATAQPSTVRLSEAPRPTLGGSDASLSRENRPFEPVTPDAAEVQRWRALPHWSFGPFDTARYGYERITLYLDRERVSDDDVDRINAYAIVTIVARLDRPSGEPVWWQFTGLSESSPDRADPGRFDISPEPHDKHERAALATPDATIPLFTLTYRATNNQPRSSTIADMQLLLDFRQPTPAIAAIFGTSEIDGHCAVQYDGPTTACTWVADRGDFICTEQWHDGARYFLLSTDARLDRLPWQTGPRDLDEFTRRLESDLETLGAAAVADREASLSDVGAVRLIRILRSRRAHRRFFLFAGRKNMFHLVAREAGRTIVTRHVTAASASGFSPDEEAEEDADAKRRGPFLPARMPSTVLARIVFDDRRGFRLLRLTGGRTVYHLGIEESQGKVIADAIEVASHQPYSPDICGIRYRPTAWRVRMTRAPFRLDYDLVPGFELTTGDDHYFSVSSPCAAHSRASWIHGKGFDMDIIEGDCPSHEQLREVTLDDEGRIQVRHFPRKPEWE